MHPVSRLALIFSCLFIFCTGVFYFPKWKQGGTEATISWDVAGYYMYLPALFIYKDIKQCRFKDYVIREYSPTPEFKAAYQHPSGNYVMKYSAGQALMLSPFFFAGHAIALNSDSYKADGFSYPYQICIGLGMLLIAFIGLLALRKVLLQYFPDTAVAITMTVIVFATNYLDYAAINGAMTHNTLFTIYALLLYCTIQFYKRPSTKMAMLIGCLSGLASLTRPTEIISILIPLLWNISSVKELKERFRFFADEKKFILLSAAFFLLFVALQIFYWKSVTGEWLVYSYQDETFSWLSPHIVNAMFSYRSGWLLYSPAMGLALIGFVQLYRKHRSIFWPALVFSVLFMYICFSWDVWWYGASLGQRAMVQSYPVLALPLAAFMQYLFSKGRLVKFASLIFLLFCAWYNLWLTHQAHWGGLLRAGEMTKAYFWGIFGKLDVPERTVNLLDNDVVFADEPENPVLLYMNDFENDSLPNTMVKGITGRSIYLDKDYQFSPEYPVPLPPSGKKRIRATADFFTGDRESITWKMTQFGIKFYKDDKIIRYNQIRVQRILAENEVKNMVLDCTVPSNADRMKVSFWNAGSDKEIFIDNLKLICF